jgi:hypothetical protein
MSFALRLPTVIGMGAGVSLLNSEIFRKMMACSLAVPVMPGSKFTTAVKVVFQGMITLLGMDTLNRSSSALME